ncbi:uncharacterized protein FIBRA_03338 [Fibroporia radiculosa]|uniref:Uncharacterized protein n=1 Tax=Fibroporia radiculosa TaxID=599839 RepID=J4H2C6_9APHY|nr:uncharacterized protein FIBRA_03338 [Fibroporia radiculosa]CCM01289.1 predicted protein [Fibroporia radiculosa]
MASAPVSAGPSRSSPQRQFIDTSPSTPDTNADIESDFEDEYTPSDGSESDYESAMKDQALNEKDFKGKTVPRPHARTSSSDTRIRDGSKPWTDLDLSIIVACVSPIGNWLTGGDHVKNLFLVILLIFYLHQLVEVPWGLYQASRPRKPVIPHSSLPANRAVALAATELRQQELFLLLLTIVSPLIGALFLQYMLDTLGGAESLSWFSTTLFVLATGIRPWSHLISRVRARTTTLHDAIHYPPTAEAKRTDEELAKVTKRLLALEEEMKELRERAAHGARLQVVCDDLSEALGNLERGTKRNERKADSARVAFTSRLAALEKGLVQLDQNRRLDMDALKTAHAYSPPVYLVVYKRLRSYVAPFATGLLRLPMVIWTLGSLDVDAKRPDKYGGNGSDAGVVRNGILKNASVNGNVSLVRTPSGQHSGSPHLPTIQEVRSDVEADVEADSDGTYVSEKEKGEPLSPAINPKERLVKRVRSRSRSRSGGSGSTRSSMGRMRRMPSFHEWAFELAQSIVLWPYHASVRILVAIAPPVHRILKSFRA